MALKFPADFDKCVREGGRVRTIQPKPGKYIHVCWDKAGESHAGEVKTKKKASEIDSYLINLGYKKTDDGFKMSETELKMLVPQIALSEKAFKQKTAEIEVLHSGEWQHPQYGLITISEDDIDKFIASFENKVRKVDLAVDQEHMPEKGAAGWYKDLKKVDDNGQAKLMATIEWTPIGQQLIKDGIFKYFSPEFDFDYEDLETHDHFENVLIGGALTNRPYFKSLAPVALSENMYAGFTSIKSTKKGGEKNMTKKELTAKLAEDADYKLPKDASDEDKKLFKEVKAGLAKEAEKQEEEKKKAEEARKLKEQKDSKKFISVAEHTKQMNELKSEMGIVQKKLRTAEVKKQVRGYVFSESNPDGVLLPKNRDAAVDLLMAATPKQAKLFSEFLKELPKVSAKLFREEGGAEGDADKTTIIEGKANKMVEEKKAPSYGEAIKLLQAQEPDLFK